MTEGMTDPGIAASSQAPARERDRAIKSVEHAIEILNLMASQQGGLGVTSIASRLDLNASSVHHILKTLQAHQMVEQSPDSKLYRLGILSLRLGQAYLVRLDLHTIALPLLKCVARKCGETTTLAAVDGQRIAELATIPGAYTVRSLGAPTNNNNAHATALGKVVLASLSSDDLQEHLAKIGLTRYTSRTIHTYRAIENELAFVREHGYAVDREELELGLCCVGAGVRNHVGDLVAALAISTPSSRFSDEQSMVLVSLAVKAARQISARLGYETAESNSVLPELELATRSGAAS